MGTLPVGRAQRSPVPPSTWGHPANAAEAVTAIQLFLQVHLVLHAASASLCRGPEQGVPDALGRRSW